MVPIWYATLGDVMTAADIKLSGQRIFAIQNALTEGTQAVEELCRRVFYPTVETIRFPWPQDQSQSSRVLELGKHELISVTSVANGDGSTISSANLTLAPQESGPPYSQLITDQAFVTNSSFPQNSLGVSGVSGYKIVERAVALTTATTSLSGDTVTVNTGTRSIGVGALIRIGTERLVVLEKRWIDSGNLVAITLTAQNSSDRITVTNGAAYGVGEEILIESERMLITDIVGNVLIVERDYGGSALASHTAITAVYVQRQLIVERGVLGTSAADIGSGASVQLFIFPPLVRQLCRAETLNILQQDTAAYARESGSGEGKAEAKIYGLEALRKKVLESDLTRVLSRAV